MYNLQFPPTVGQDTSNGAESPHPALPAHLLDPTCRPPSSENGSLASDHSSSHTAHTPPLMGLTKLDVAPPHHMSALLSSNSSSGGGHFKSPSAAGPMQLFPPPPHHGDRSGSSNLHLQMQQQLHQHHQQQQQQQQQHGSMFGHQPMLLTDLVRERVRRLSCKRVVGEEEEKGSRLTASLL